MNESSDQFDLIFTAIMSVLSIWVLHIFLPFLLSLSIALYVNYRFLQNIRCYGNSYNLLVIVVLSVGFFNGFFQEFTLAQTEAALGMGFLLIIGKLLLQIPGISLRSKVVGLQISGIGSTLASKSILGVLFSMVNIQSVLVFAAIGLAIFLILPIELLMWVLGVRTPVLLIYGGLISLGMVGIVLDLKDKVKVVAGKIKHTDSSNSDTSEAIPREFAKEFCNEIDAEFPSLEEVTWSKSDIRKLSMEEFYFLCSQAAERESEPEGSIKQRFNEPDPFGYAYHLIDDEVDILELGLATEQNQESIDYAQADQYILDMIEREQITADIIVISSDITIEPNEQVEVLSNYGIYIGGIDFVRRRFEEYNITPDLLERQR